MCFYTSASVELRTLTFIASYSAQYDAVIIRIRTNCLIQLPYLEESVRYNAQRLP